MSDAIFVRAWVRDGSYFTIVPTDEQRIDAGVTLFLGSGGSRDSLLDLTLVDGGPLRVLASEITCWVVSSPQSRIAQRAWEADMDDEEKEEKRARGWIDEDDL